MPKLVSANEISVGMELAVQVKNKFGQVLLNSGIKLEQKHKNVLKTWGIDALLIVEESDSLTDRAHQESKIEEAKKILSARMNWHIRNSEEKELYEMALLHILNNHLQ